MKITPILHIKVMRVLEEVAIFFKILSLTSLGDLYFSYKLKWNIKKSGCSVFSTPDANINKHIENFIESLFWISKV